MRGAVEDETGMVGVAGIEAGMQDHVEEVVVVVEAKADKVGMEVFELIEGLTSLQEAFLDLQRFEEQ